MGNQGKNHRFHSSQGGNSCSTVGIARLALICCSCKGLPEPERWFIWVFVSAELWSSAWQHHLNESEGSSCTSKDCHVYTFKCTLGIQTKALLSKKGNMLLIPSWKESLSLCSAFLPFIFIWLAMHKATVKGQMCRSCNPSPGCDSCMFCWLCHAETLLFLWRNYMTIKLQGTVTFQVSFSSPLFPCLTFPWRNLSFDCEFWPGNNLMAPFLTVGLWLAAVNILILCSEEWLIPPVWRTSWMN